METHTHVVTWKHTWETQKHLHGNTASSGMETDMETHMGDTETLAWKQRHAWRQTWKHTTVETRTHTHVGDMETCRDMATHHMDT